MLLLNAVSECGFRMLPLKAASESRIQIQSLIMNWNQIKKRLEEFICPELQGRVQFYITTYRRENEVVGRGWVTVDGEEILNIPSEERQQFYEALRDYPDSDIEKALGAADVVVRGLAMIDRRVGKRRLQRMDISNDAPFVQFLYRLRCEVENINRTES